MFTGVIIITIRISFGIYEHHISDLNTTSYLNKPVVSDLYLVNLGKLFNDV